MTRPKCIVCERRPVQPGRDYCHNCESKIQADRRSRQKEAPVKYITYQGCTVALIRNHDGKLVAIETKRNPYRPDPFHPDKEIPNIPKSKLIDLNHYCEGYTREQIKMFKRAVRQTCHV